jgi:hypothetical protein
MRQTIPISYERSGALPGPCFTRFVRFTPRERAFAVQNGMSALGHKRTCAVHSAMSALGKSDLLPCPTHFEFVLFSACASASGKAMRRRDFIILICIATSASPLAAWAQHAGQVRRIGVLMAIAENDPEGQARVAAFREGLRKFGWVDGRNIQIETRWALPRDKKARQRFAKELIGLKPDVILSHATPTTATLLQLTRTVPIVFVGVSDPIGSGFVESYARPGGNATGFSVMAPTMGGKWVELLKEIAPRVNRVTLLFNPATAPYVKYYMGSYKAAAACPL